jgi:hypothetical protein
MKQPQSRIRVVSLNTQRCFGRLGKLPEFIATARPDVLLLQECCRSWFQAICRAADISGVYAPDAEPRLKGRTNDGTAIAVRSPLGLENARRLEPAGFGADALERPFSDDLPSGFVDLPESLARRYSARSLIADIELGGQSFCVGSFHATPGKGDAPGGGTVGEWKPLFHGAVAVALSELNGPFLFAIDANEPELETETSVTFYWRRGRPGSRKMAALLGLDASGGRIHRARDLNREGMVAAGTKPESDDLLIRTHSLRGGAGRHFDHLYATDEFGLDSYKVDFEGAIKAGTDHAMLIADLTFASA